MTQPHPRSLRALALGLSLTLLAAPAAAQTAEVEDWRATRTQLQAEVQRLERSLASPAYSEATRRRALERLTAIQRRLAEGDFTVGERIYVQVQGQTVALNDTLTVQDSVLIVIPNIRRVRLAGVLRSELQELVSREVAEVVRGASVRATSLMRVAVVGEVARPGYHTVPPETLVDQLMMLAGGPTPNGDVGKLRLERGDTLLAAGGDVRVAIARGRTLASLDVRNGDALVVPARPQPWDRASTLNILSLLIGPLLTIVLVR